jgi:hypothetical protein
VLKIYLQLQPLKKLTQKYNKIYGPIKVSDLINAHLNEPNNIAKEIGKG